jgi:hypothetical protein
MGALPIWAAQRKFFETWRLGCGAGVDQLKLTVEEFDTSLSEMLCVEFSEEARDG